MGFSIVHTDIREKFMATLSHDLRNPLSSAQVAAQMILRRPNDPSVPNLAARIVESHRRIDSMIQDLLDATMVRSGGRLKVEVHECDLVDVVNECILHASLSYGSRFVLEGESSCKGFWSEKLLKRAFENLINNAVKYGDPVTAITFKIHSEHGRVFVSIHNEGTAIPINEQEGIFQIFRRTASSRGSNKKGWGIGLSLVRGVAEGHGGSVILDSSPAHGTTFTIDIPIDGRPFQDKI